jgi:hypothetical protein
LSGPSIPWRHGAYEAGFFVSGYRTLGGTGLANVAVTQEQCFPHDVGGRYQMSLAGGALI